MNEGSGRREEGKGKFYSTVDSLSDKKVMRGGKWKVVPGKAVDYGTRMLERRVQVGAKGSLQKGAETMLSTEGSG